MATRHQRKAKCKNCGEDIYASVGETGEGKYVWFHRFNSDMYCKVQTAEPDPGALPTEPGAYYDEGDRVWILYDNKIWRAYNSVIYDIALEQDLEDIKKHLPFRRLEPID